jgi:hypothetical protein
LKFPEKIYTLKEFRRARALIKKGYKHHIKIVGSKKFKERVKIILALIQRTEYYDFIRTYIRRIEEIEGLSQLRETEATIWLNTYMIKNIIEGARFIVQKAEQMNGYLSGKQYYEKGELHAVKKSVEFLKNLKSKMIDEKDKEKISETIKLWTAETIL